MICVRGTKNKKIFNSLNCVLILLTSIFIAYFLITLYANALWISRVSINTYVGTGNSFIDFTFCKGFSCCSCSHYNYLSKIRCNINGESLSVKLENAYPGWQGILIVGVINKGTIPLSISSKDIIIEKTGKLAKYIRVECPIIMKYIPLQYDDIISRLKKFLKNGCNSKVLLDNNERALIIIKLGLDKQADYGLTGYLTINIKAKQFNR